MLRFSNRSTGRPRDYFRRREQWRLLLLVFLLGGTVLIALKVSDPGFWATALSRLGFDESSETNVASEDAESKEYTPYVPPPAEGPADAIEIVSEYQRQQIAEGGDRLPGVNLEYLAAVKDNRPHRQVERLAWLNLFEVLRNNDPAFIKAVARDDVSYVQLYRQSAEYRGQLVTLKGAVRRAEKIPFGKNSLGVEHAYRLMLQVPAGASRTRPVFVIALELPKEFPVRFEMREEIEVSGFSYKKLPYTRADGKPEIAPILLAGPIEWFPETESRISASDVMWVTVGIAVVVMFGTWYWSRPRPLGLGDGERADEDSDGDSDGGAFAKLTDYRSRN